jgi:hypothetical protein
MPYNPQETKTTPDARTPRRMNVIKFTCEGTGKRFKGQSCPYYASKKRICRLLREQRMGEFWKTCRGAFEILYEAVNTWSKKFQAQYPDLPIDEAEYVDFEDIMRRLNIYQPDEKNLNVWHKYVHRTVYLELKRNLVNQGLIPRTNTCGTCKHLTKSKPYICTQTGETKKKTHCPCEEYSPDILEPLYINEDAPYHENSDAQNPDRLLLELVKAKLDQENTAVILSKLTRAIEMLTQRANSAKPDSKACQRYKRQSEIFILLQDLLSKGFAREKAEKSLAETYHISPKTIQRDIAEIKTFLQQKMSSKE